ncbi:hypothetical protein PVAP13_2KG298160 [Panicum virgatum]|uniref:DUF6598 domain-containing protein n=1 Tax=Panicum virgatum TaxID=38727 RepID=A0A8T0W4K5_PANVG|nr:hypothetical protein PVAP13_2KG298160 [Panicum virgatum]
MPTLSRSMFKVGRVASDLLRRLSLFPTLARRDATPTVMTSKSAHADRLSHQDCLSRLVYKSWIPCRLISIAHATTRCLDTQNVTTEDKELIDCKPRMDRIYFVPVIKDSSHRDGAIYKNKFIREDFWEGDIADRNEMDWRGQHCRWRSREYEKGEQNRRAWPWPSIPGSLIDLQLIDGAISCYDRHSGWPPIKNRICGNYGAVDISLGIVEQAVEATIEVVISEVMSGFSLWLSSFVDVMNDGALRRFVVAVSWQTMMLLKFKVGSEGCIDCRQIKLQAKKHGCASQQIELKVAAISVKVTWSTI